MIYLDNSATTRPCGAAVAAARKMIEEDWYNPSALYGPAVRVERAVSAARASVAASVGAAPQEVVFTGSGTEADSLAILGAAARFRGPRRILLFAAEHPAVRETCAQLEGLGHTVAWIPSTAEGTVDTVALAGMLDGDVGLISCMQVGNETGAVQPLREIAALRSEKAPQALLHVDGIQGYLRLPLDLKALGIDLYAISAHKVHGLKGTGALIVRRGTRIAGRTLGGGQEGALRSGTENTAGIAAFGAAVDWYRGQEGCAQRLREMKLHLYERLQASIDGLRVNGPAPESEAAAPHILNVSIPGVGGEVMVHALEQEGVYVGTGAACSSKKRDMSAAFAAMQAPKWAAETAIRFSFGLMNTMDEAEQTAEAVLRCHDRYKTFQRR